MWRRVGFGKPGMAQSPWQSLSLPWWEASVGKLLLVCNTAAWQQAGHLILTLVSRASKWYSACLLCSPFHIRLVLLVCKCTAAYFSQALQWVVKNHHLWWFLFGSGGPKVWSSLCAHQRALLICLCCFQVLLTVVLWDQATLLASLSNSDGFFLAATSYLEWSKSHQLYSHDWSN